MHDPVVAARLAELEALVEAQHAALEEERTARAKAEAERDRLREAYEALTREVELARRRLVVAKAERVDTTQLERTFRTNFFGMFLLTRSTLPHLHEGSAIINTTSVTAYRGSPGLIDYSATKGAIVAFTRSLAKSVAERGIRVNGVAPGPIWTPLIPASFSAEEVASFGADTPLKRPGQPEEVAPCYVFLASEDGSYMTGQVLHPNGGEVVNG